MLKSGQRPEYFPAAFDFYGDLKMEEIKKNTEFFVCLFVFWISSPNKLFRAQYCKVLDKPKIMPHPCFMRFLVRIISPLARLNIARYSSQIGNL